MREFLVEYDSGYIESYDKLLSNSLISESKKIEEEKINGIPIIVYAVLQKYGVKNVNNRIYSEAILKRETNKLMQTTIPMGSCLLEANHPETGNIDVLNVGGGLLDLWWTGITCLGKIKLNLSKAFINNGEVFTSGDEIANLMMNGFRVGVSSRGIGTLKKVNGVNIVQDDFDLICWDFVNQPSSKGSWVATEMESLKQYIDETPEPTPIILPKEEFSYSKMKDSLSEYLKKYK